MVVAQRGAASKACLRVLEHIRDRRKASVRMRRERPTAQVEVVEDDDGGSSLAQLVEIAQIAATLLTFYQKEHTE
jgi:hypothetical protein